MPTRISLKRSLFSGIGRTLFTWFLLISMVPLAVVSFFSYQTAHQQLFRDTEKSLAVAVELKKEYIEYFFSSILTDLELQARHETNVNFLIELELLFDSLAIPGKEFVTNEWWLDLVSNYRPNLEEFQRIQGYRDLLFIDPAGNILFSVQGEDDQGTNIFDGKYADTMFGRVCRKALGGYRTMFSDMEAYAPSHDEQAGFFVRPMHDKNGKEIGLIALRISPAQINRIMQDTVGMGETGTTILVGENMLMRSNPRFGSEKGAQQTRGNTEITQKWLEAERKKHQAGSSSAVPAGPVPVSSYVNYRGVQVLGLFKNLDMLEEVGVHWTMLAEIDEDEALGPIRRLRQIVVGMFFGTAFLVLLAALLFTRGIVLPIRRLSVWARQVARGNLADSGMRPPADELGELHESFTQVVASYRGVTEVCEAIAVGNFKKSIALRSQEDDLGAAVNQMADNLRAILRQVQVVSRGDYSIQITPWSDEDELGIALLTMTNTLRELECANSMALEKARRLADNLDNLPIPVLTIDREFQITYINPAGAAVLGLTPAGCADKHCYDLFRNPHCQTLNCQVGLAMRENRVASAETVLNPAGRRIPISYTGAPIKNAKGEIIGALECIFDIRKMKEALEATQRENWLQNSIAAINDRTSGEVDMERLCTHVLSSLAELLDIQAGVAYVAVGKGMLRPAGCYSTTGVCSAGVAFPFGQGLAGQAAREKKRLLVHDLPEDGLRFVSGLAEVIPRQIVAVPLLYQNEVNGVLELGSFSGFKDNELELLNRVAVNVAIAVNTVNYHERQLELLQETRRQAEALQVQQEELKAANEELEIQTRQLKQSEGKLRTQREELQVTNEELEEKTEHLQRQKTDIEKKNSELDATRLILERKAEELAIASKYKSEFLANMSHELRTPLNSLLLLARNFSRNRDGNLNPSQIESAEVIYNSGKDLLGLINQILDLSKIEAGRVDLALEPVALQNFLNELGAGFFQLFSEKGLGFTMHLEPGVTPVITTDNQRLGQILRNLLANALKFTENGEVAVTVRSPRPGEKSPGRALEAGKWVIFDVSDSGIGIPLEKQKVIFEAFQQADGGTARKYGGTGLGLSISRELAHLLGGEIRLASEPGRGSTFSLDLPVQPAAEKQEANGARPATQSREDHNSSVPEPQRPLSRPLPVAIPDDREQISAGDKVLLIIEDDPNFARILLQQGHEKGFKCLTSASGGGSLALAEKFQPSGILLDINLPDIDGWTVLASLKNEPSLRHIPVHMMSVSEKTVDAFRKGAIGYLVKPVKQEDLHLAFSRLEEMIAKQFSELLVVEDNAILRQEIVNLIGNGDVVVTMAASGTEAMEMLRAKRYDCMILDIGLPDMSGFELLSLMEEEELVKIPPIIIYTGRDLTREESEILCRYTDSVIVKGVKSEERLLDETALFLHRVVSRLPAEKQKIIASLYEQDAMFKDKMVLIVDDDMRNAFALTKILEERQMRIHIAYDGRSALEFLAAKPDVDLVLMDIMMPVMDGFETIQRIRAQEQFWNLPIIALTAKAMTEDKEKCMAAGASDYLAKPVEEGRLLSMMRVWLYR